MPLCNIKRSYWFWEVWLIKVIVLALCLGVMLEKDSIAEFGGLSATELADMDFKF